LANATLTDSENAFTWNIITPEYDESGNLSSQVMNYDDGTIV